MQSCPEIRVVYIYPKNIELSFQVTYQTEQFLEKNKDYVVAEHQALLGASMCTFIADLFPPLMEDANKQSKFSSIASQFKVPLNEIVSM